MLQSGIRLPFARYRGFRTSALLRNSANDLQTQTCDLRIDKTNGPILSVSENIARSLGLDEEIQMMGGEVSLDLVKRQSQSFLIPTHWTIPSRKPVAFVSPPLKSDPLFNESHPFEVSNSIAEAFGLDKEPIKLTLLGPPECEPPWNVIKSDGPHAEFLRFMNQSEIKHRASIEFLKRH